MNAHEEVEKLFDEVVKHLGLAMWVGPGVLKKALSSAGLGPQEPAREEHYHRALPELKERMAVYLHPGELQQRVAAIEALLSRAPLRA